MAHHGEVKPAPHHSEYRLELWHAGLSGLITVEKLIADTYLYIAVQQSSRSPGASICFGEFIKFCTGNLAVYGISDLQREMIK